MKNYQDSDYALNRYSPNIVYRMATGIIEVTLADFLVEYPGKTEADFVVLKAFSDDIYKEQDRAGNVQTKKNVHLNETMVDSDEVPFDEAFLDELDRETAGKAFAALIADGSMTEKQARRFRLRIFEGLTFREIAEREWISVKAVQQSVAAAVDKLKKYFDFF